VNSKPLTDDRVYEEYKQRFGGFDEATYWAGVMIDGKGRLVGGHAFQQLSGNLVRHHLWSLGRRPDFRSNLLIVTERMHLWFHDNLSASRVIGVVAKLRKSESLGEPEEFSLAEITEAAGKFISGVIGSYNFVDPLLRRLNDEAIERLAVLEREAS
jgi:hypothetical protein